MAESPAENFVNDDSGKLNNPEQKEQQNLFPVEIIEVYPNDQGSADMQYIGHGRDGRDYAIKTTDEGNGYVATSEMFCYELARLVFIPVPEYTLVMLNDHLAFGSVWQGAATNISQDNEVLELVSDASLPLEIFETISKIYGLDLFINNIDRHFGNYLFTTGYNNRKIALAFDFGRSWLEVDYKGLEVLEPSAKNKTYTCQKFLKRAGKLNTVIAIDTIDKLSALDSSMVEDILRQIPHNWLPKGFYDEFIKWWGSTDFFSRIKSLKMEAANV